MPADATRKLVVVAAPRTGSTMLATMLNAHPDVVCGGEVLNDVWIDTGGRIDWAHKSRHARALEDDPAIHALRREDPIAFLGRLNELAAAEGFRVVGFKLLYAHGSLRAGVVEYLAGLPDLSVIHLRRLDRLRRLVSLKRAVASGEWVARDAAGSLRCAGDDDAALGADGVARGVSRSTMMSSRSVLHSPSWPGRTRP